jgi:hypothetical protein
LYYERPSEDEQLLVRPFLRKTNNTTMAGGLNLTFFFFETPHELLHLKTYEAWHNEGSRTYQQVLFKQLFSCTDLLNLAMMGISNYWGGCKNLHQST